MQLNNSSALFLCVLKGVYLRDTGDRDHEAPQRRCTTPLWTGLCFIPASLLSVKLFLSNYWGGLCAPVNANKSIRPWFCCLLTLTRGWHCLKVWLFQRLHAPSFPTTPPCLPLSLTSDSLVGFVTGTATAVGSAGAPITTSLPRRRADLTVPPSPSASLRSAWARGKPR